MVVEMVVEVLTQLQHLKQEQLILVAVAVPVAVMVKQEVVAVLE